MDEIKNESAGGNNGQESRSKNRKNYYRRNKKRSGSYYRNNRNDTQKNMEGGSGSSSQSQGNDENGKNKRPNYYYNSYKNNNNYNKNNNKNKNGNKHNNSRSNSDQYKNSGKPQNITAVNETVKSDNPTSDTWNNNKSARKNQHVSNDFGNNKNNNSGKSRTITDVNETVNSDNRSTDTGNNDKAAGKSLPASNSTNNNKNNRRRRSGYNNNRYKGQSNNHRYYNEKKPETADTVSAAKERQPQRSGKQNGGISEQGKDNYGNSRKYERADSTRQRTERAASGEQLSSDKRTDRHDAPEVKMYERKQKNSPADADRSEPRVGGQTTVFHAVKEQPSRRTRNSRSTEQKISPEQQEMNRRKSDRRFWARLFSLAVIIPAYLMITACAVLLPRSTVSNIEKRTLAQFPTFTWEDYYSGKYTADIASYFDDTVPFRDFLKQTASRFTGLFGIKYNNVQVSGSMEVVNRKTTDTQDMPDTRDNSETNEQDVSSSGGKYSGSISKNGSTDTEQRKGEEIAEGVYANGVIVVYMNGHYRAMSMYGGGSGNNYVSALNNFASDLPGVKIYSLIAPTASEFYTPENFSDYNASQEDDIKSINSMLRGVKGINVCPTLLSRKQETIYTRTDHHWMSLGAYYAAKDFASAAGVPFLDLSQYTRNTKHGYVGTLYSFSGNNADLLNDPEDFIYYVPKEENYTTEYYDQSFNFVYEGSLFPEVKMASEYYSTFMNGDAYSVKISTSVKNGRRCLVVKDSYGDAFVPFLTGSFEEIYTVDMRYFQRNLVEFAEKQGITDLLFTCCSYSAVGTNADHLESLRTGGIFIDSPEPETEPESQTESETEQESQPENEGETEPPAYETDSEEENDYTEENVDFEEQPYEEEYSENTGDMFYTGE